MLAMISAVDRGFNQLLNYKNNVWSVPVDKEILFYVSPKTFTHLSKHPCLHRNCVCSKFLMGRVEWGEFMQRPFQFVKSIL